MWHTPGKVLHKGVVQSQTASSLTWSVYLAFLFYLPFHSCGQESVLPFGEVRKWGLTGWKSQCLLFYSLCHLESGPQVMPSRQRKLCAPEGASDLPLWDEREQMHSVHTQAIWAGRSKLQARGQDPEAIYCLCSCMLLIISVHRGPARTESTCLWGTGTPGSQMVWPMPLATWLERGEIKATDVVRGVWNDCRWRGNNSKCFSFCSHQKLRNEPFSQFMFEKESFQCLNESAWEKKYEKGLYLKL